MQRGAMASAVLMVAVGCTPPPAPVAPAAGPPPVGSGSGSALTFEGERYQDEMARSFALAASARSLSDTTAKELEDQLQKDPSNLDARLSLIAHYGMRPGRLPHLLWLIENHPDHPALRYGLRISPLEGDAYLKANQLWERQLAAHPTSLSVLANAASFYTPFNLERAQALYAKARELEPGNVTWMTSAAEVHMLRARRGADRAEAALALADYRAALERGGPRRAFLTAHAAKAALAAGDTKEAAAFAEQSLEAQWSPTGDDVHAGNIVLGKLALDAGDTTKAGAYLVAACRTSATPVLRSFGPDMTLAADLLQRGERKAVIDYLDACASIWDTGREKLGRWKAELEQGGSPDLKGTTF